MKPIETQISFADINPEYQAFVDKFKPKKTTDDCYTPENVYQAIKDWVCGEYGVDPGRVVRPFWPGSDYERFPYKEGDTVIDNPPFSIMVQIVRFYNAYEIPYFLFAPYLTNFSIGMAASHIITATSITYENGADVGTSFLTNLDEYIVRGVPELRAAIKAANDANLKEMRRKTPKYVYPPEVLTAAAVGYMCNHGIEYRLRKEDAFPVREIESQKATGKTIFGAGFLLSERAAAERAAAERAAAERAAAERAAATVWTLSEKEKAIVRSLGGAINGHTDSNPHSTNHGSAVQHGGREEGNTGTPGIPGIRERAAEGLPGLSDRGGVHGAGREVGG